MEEDEESLGGVRMRCRDSNAVGSKDDDEDEKGDMVELTLVVSRGSPERLNGSKDGARVQVS